MAEKREASAAGGRYEPDLSKLVEQAVVALGRLNDTLQAMEDRLDGGAPQQTAQPSTSPAAGALAPSADVAEVGRLLADLQAGLGITAAPGRFTNTTHPTSGS